MPRRCINAVSSILSIRLSPRRYLDIAEVEHRPLHKSACRTQRFSIRSYNISESVFAINLYPHVYYIKIILYLVLIFYNNYLFISYPVRNPTVLLGFIKSQPCI